MCTRTLYVGDDETVITGRNMDWREDMASDLWAFPLGMSRQGAAGPGSLTWVSSYGSVVTAGYDIGTTDGINDNGLVANLLYLAESDYGVPRTDRPYLCIAAWTQFVLDRFGSVAEAVTELASETFTLLAPCLPDGTAATLHLALSDATGDSAILEYIEGRLVIHHGREFTVMTNSPIYDEQLAIDRYWRGIGGLTFLPGTNRAADRFARASFLLGAIPKSLDEAYIRGVPDRSFTYQAVAGVLSVQRAVSVPLGIRTPGQPNLSSTIWRTVSDHRNRVYYFDSATRPNTFWVSLANLDLSVGAPTRTLRLRDGEVYAGDVADRFVEARPFDFLEAEPPSA